VEIIVGSIPFETRRRAQPAHQAKQLTSAQVLNQIWNPEIPASPPHTSCLVLVTGGSARDADFDHAVVRIEAKNVHVSEKQDRITCSADLLQNRECGRGAYGWLRELRRENSTCTCMGLPGGDLDSYGLIVWSLVELCPRSVHDVVAGSMPGPTAEFASGCDADTAMSVRPGQTGKTPIYIIKDLDAQQKKKRKIVAQLLKGHQYIIFEPLSTRRSEHLSLRLANRVALVRFAIATGRRASTWTVRDGQESGGRAAEWTASADRENSLVPCTNGMASTLPTSVMLEFSSACDTKSISGRATLHQ
ncbi:hypothetical protein FOCC_FOCC006317, partial [Frankliniella occidentalis]